MKLLGRGVFARQDVLQGQFIVQYCGELVDEREGDRKEAIAETGFRYFFEHHRSKYWYWTSLILLSLSMSLSLLLMSGL